ncbi:MAG: hypothetical protein K0M69_17960, partial [Youngiibacter sp.]|nr:hypothetical protein [Youngiibacter sp.]
MESVNQMPEQSKELLAYDIEVFSHDALVIFKTMDKKVAGIFHNNFEGVRDLIKDKTLVGYNIYNYDDFILSRMIEGWTPELLKRLNDTIIRGEDHPKYVDSVIDSLDCFQEIHVSRPSLKRIEGNMGRMILESSVPFDIDRPLTMEELDEVINYCSYDVDMVIEVYKLREKNYFKSKKELLKLAGNDKAKRWNTTTISANILVKKP